MSPAATPFVLWDNNDSKSILIKTRHAIKLDGVP